MQFHHEISIRERAYAIWEQEGRPQGREWDHWVRAAGEVTAPAVAPTLQAAPAVKTTGASRKAPAKAKAKKG